MKGNNDSWTNQFEQLNSLTDSLGKTSKENYELIEQLKTEKTLLKNTIYSLESEMINLKLGNEDFVSEREVKAQLLEELRK